MATLFESVERFPLDTFFGCNGVCVCVFVFVTLFILWLPDLIDGCDLNLSAAVSKHLGFV